jgi:hypothetical protein
MKSYLRINVRCIKTTDTDARIDMNDFIRTFLKIFINQDEGFKEEWLKFTDAEKREAQAIITRSYWKGVAAAWQQLVDDGCMSTEQAASDLLDWVSWYAEREELRTAELINAIMWEANHRVFLYDGILCQRGFFKSKIENLDKALNS